MSASANEVFNIRHRLVGAFVLIATAVVVLPLVLNGDGNQPIAVDINTPSEQRAPREFVSRIQPVGETRKIVVETDQGEQVQFATDSASTTEQASAPTPGAANTESTTAPSGNDQGAGEERPVQAAVTPEPTASTRTPVDRVTADTKVAPAPSRAVEKTITSARAPTESKPVKPANQAKPAAPADTTTRLSVETDRGWIVSVGVFGDPTNVTRNIALLKSKQFEPRTTRHKSKDGKVTTRVWVGPFAERVTAGRVQDRIESAIGERGFIMAYP